MKSLISLALLVGLMGCAGHASKPSGVAMPYEQLKPWSRNYQCRDIEFVVSTLETQLRIKGIAGMNPEDLNEEDRMYNAQVRIIVWSMRIVCNNPGRYAQ